MRVKAHFYVDVWGCLRITPTPNIAFQINEYLTQFGQEFDLIFIQDDSEVYQAIDDFELPGTVFDDFRNGFGLDWDFWVDADTLLAYVGYDAVDKLVLTGPEVLTITDDDFHRILHNLLSEMSLEEILSYGEVHSFFAEELNNQVIKAWEQEASNDKTTENHQ